MRSYVAVVAGHGAGWCPLIRPVDRSTGIASVSHLTWDDSSESSFSGRSALRPDPNLPRGGGRRWENLFFLMDLPCAGDPLEWESLTREPKRIPPLYCPQVCGVGGLSKTNKINPAGQAAGCSSTRPRDRRALQGAVWQWEGGGWGSLKVAPRGQLAAGQPLTAPVSPVGVATDRSLCSAPPVHLPPGGFVR